jgi:hypothetical protein
LTLWPARRMTAISSIYNDSIHVKYNLKMSVNKTKAKAVKGKTNVRNKSVVNDHTNK